MAPQQKGPVHPGLFVGKRPVFGSRRVGKQEHCLDEVVPVGVWDERAELGGGLSFGG